MYELLIFYTKIISIEYHFIWMLTDDVTSSYLKRRSLMARLTFMKAIYFFKTMYI